MSAVDFVVVGAGIAGASIAAHLAEKHRVVLLEREDRPGYHSTGRSAALFTEIYGNPIIRALTRASRPFLFEPQPDFAEEPLTRPRGCLYIATQEQLSDLAAFAALPDVAPATHSVSIADAQARCPILRDGYVAGALYEPHAADIDVAGLHQGYLRWFRRREGRLVANATVDAIDRSGDHWHVRAGGETVAARVLVNAAGAWADQIAGLAGLSPVGLTPRRRTAVLVDVPAGVDVARMPFVNDIGDRFYFKPEAGALFLSPADETASEPCDAQPDEWDVAAAVERLERATTLEVKRLKSKWAGLRTFAPDRTPVVGFAPQAQGFFWLAGQGGYGIQTAPALSRVAAALAQELPVPDGLLHLQSEVAELSPARFAGAPSA